MQLELAFPRALGATSSAQQGGGERRRPAPEAGIERMRPMTVYIMSLLSEDLLAGDNPVMDDFLHAYARKKKIPVLGLESYEEQFAHIYVIIVSQRFFF